jgi:hypothetical protein
MKTIGFSAIGIALLYFGACGLGEDESCACTKEYAAVVVTVLDASGDLELDFPATVVVLRTGSELPVAQRGADSGTYTVITDSEKKLVRAEGENIRISGEKDGRAFTGDFEIGVPGVCRCHVRKVSGPDTLRTS